MLELGVISAEYGLLKENIAPRICFFHACFLFTNLNAHFAMIKMSTRECHSILGTLTSHGLTWGLTMYNLRKLLTPHISKLNLCLITYNANLNKTDHSTFI